MARHQFASWTPNWRTCISTLAAMSLALLALNRTSTAEPAQRSISPDAAQRRNESKGALRLDDLEKNVRRLIIAHINTKSGAIAMRPIGAANNSIHPWFAYSAASALMDSGPEYYPYVHGWVNWMCHHINYGGIKDIYGVDSLPPEEARSSPFASARSAGVYDAREWAGTFFKYQLERGGLETKIFLLPKSEKKASKFDKGLRDSVTATDNWSASFLMLADRYIALSGDGSLATQCSKPLRSAADQIVSLLEDVPVGQLTRAAPDSRTIYTTDNMYSRAGLRAYADILRRSKNPDFARYSSLGDAIESALDEVLYNKKQEFYLTYYRQRSFDWRRFYGDGVANVIGATVDGEAKLHERAKSLWHHFISLHGSWTYFVTIAKKGKPAEFELDDRSRKGKWSVVAYAAARTGDVATALAFIHNVAEQYDDFRSDEDTMDVNELGWLLRAVILLRGSVVVDDRSAVLSGKNAKVTAFDEPPIGKELDRSFLDHVSEVRVGKSFVEVSGDSSVVLPLAVDRSADYALYYFDKAQGRKRGLESIDVSCASKQPESGDKVPSQNIKGSSARVLKVCHLSPDRPGSVRFRSMGGQPIGVDGIALVPTKLLGR